MVEFVFTVYVGWGRGGGREGPFKKGSKAVRIASQSPMEHAFAKGWPWAGASNKYRLGDLQPGRLACAGCMRRQKLQGKGRSRSMRNLGAATSLVGYQTSEIDRLSCSFGQTQPEAATRQLLREVPLSNTASTLDAGGPVSSYSPSYDEWQSPRSLELKLR